MDHNDPYSLAESFEIIRQQLNASHVEMERREQELAILNEVGMAATQLLDLQEILELALDTMVTRLGMEDALIHLWDRDSGRYTLNASRGLSKEQIEEIDRRRRYEYDISQEVVDTGKEVFVPKMSDDSRLRGLWDNLESRSYVNLPMISRGTVVGVLGLVTQSGNTLTPRGVEFLKAIGREIGIAIDNAILLADTRRREEQATTLYKLGTQISASLSLGEVLDVVAQAARELMNADIGLVGLLDEDGQDIVANAASGIQTDLSTSLSISLSEQIPWQTLREGKAYITYSDSPELPSLHEKEFIESEHIKSTLAVALQHSGRILGLIEVMTRQSKRFRPQDGRLLSRLANQVVIAIENAQLYRQLHHMAALEERDRLARELHDHLAQVLGYLKVKAAITDDLLSSGQIELAHESLMELKKTSQILYTDVREQIFNLRTAVSEQESFFATLRDYLVDYRTHYGLNVHLTVENECLSEFTTEIGSQLLRIIQEALTNVRKHSGANKVSIQCSQNGELVCVLIEDDGRGFYPDRPRDAPDQRFGLQIMQERAESVGGHLELESQPGQGTRVIVKVPSISDWR